MDHGGKAAACVPCRTTRSTTSTASGPWSSVQPCRRTCVTRIPPWRLAQRSADA